MKYLKFASLFTAAIAVGALSQGLVEAALDSLRQEK